MHGLAFDCHPSIQRISPQTLDDRVTGAACCAIIFSMVPELVFQYRLDLLKQIYAVLRKENYSFLQWIPTGRARFGLALDPGNIASLLVHGKPRLFAASAAPEAYRFLLTKNQTLLWHACFLTEWLPRSAVAGAFGNELCEQAIQNGILAEDGDRLRFTVSFVPLGPRIFLRDVYDAYCDPANHPPGLVWMGSDTLTFLLRLTDFLTRENRFESAIELGSGTGAPLIAASAFVRTALGIDYNQRAVAYTRLNAALNGAGNVTAVYSDMWRNVEGTFDLVLANPWYCDLATGGLEEVPGLLEGLDRYLRNGGVCVMILESYITPTGDSMRDFLSDFAQKERFDIELSSVGYGVVDAPEATALNISRTVSYNAILRKGGAGRVIVRPIPLIRRIKELAMLRLRRMAAAS